jgi:hypothetical protein
MKFTDSRMVAQTLRIAPRLAKTCSGLNVDTAMPRARPVAPNSTSSLS